MGEEGEKERKGGSEQRVIGSSDLVNRTARPDNQQKRGCHV